MDRQYFDYDYDDKAREQYIEKKHINAPRKARTDEETQSIMKRFGFGKLKTLSDLDDAENNAESVQRKARERITNKNKSKLD